MLWQRPRSINKLDEYDVQYMTLEKAVKVLQQAAQQTPCAPVGVRLLVGGRGRKGNFQLVMLASTENYAPQTQPARDGAYLIEGACSHTEVAPYLEQYVKPEAARWHTLDDIAKTLDGCIAKLAEADQTVNTKYFRELVM